MGDKKDDEVRDQKNTSGLDDVVPEYDKPPQYQPRSNQIIPVVNKLLNNSYMVYPSAKSEIDFNEYKKDTSSHHLEYSSGYGIPLFETTAHHFSSKFISVKKFKAPEKGAFDRKVHFDEYCTVRKYSGLECNRYVLQFADERVVVFYHTLMPIVDYEYNGIVYRWVHQNKYTLEKFRFTLLQLGPERSYSMVDSWDEKSNKLINDHPLLKFLSHFSPHVRTKKLEFYQDSIAIGELRETKRIGLHCTEISLENHFSGDFSCIDSVNGELSVHVIVGLVIKRYQDILEEQKRRLP